MGVVLEMYGVPLFREFAKKILLSPKELLRFICDFYGCFLPNCLVGRYLDVFRGEVLV